MFFLLLSIGFSSSSFSIPSLPVPNCELGSYLQPIIIIGETHFTSDALEVREYVERELYETNKIHFLVEESSLKGARFLDQPILRLYLHVNELIRGLKEETSRFVAIQWVNTLSEFQQIPHLLSVNNKTADEQVVETYFKKMSLSLTKRNAKYKVNDIQLFIANNKSVVKTYTLKLFLQMSLYAYNIYPFDLNPVPLYSDDIKLEDIKFSDLKNAFIGLDHAREAYMTQKIFDYACSSTDRLKPIVIIVGSEHAGKIKEFLIQAMPNLDISVYDGLVTFFLKKRLRSIH